MSKVYGGLVSSPYNRIDTDSRGSVTYTYNGTVINGSAGKGKPAVVPPGDTAVQVFADAECTTRPVEGGVYETLFVRLNRGYGLGDDHTYNSGQTRYERLHITTPCVDALDDPYNVALWYEFYSRDSDNPYTAGSVIPVSREEPLSLPSTFTVDFYD